MPVLSHAKSRAAFRSRAKASKRERSPTRSVAPLPTSPTAPTLGQKLTADSKTQPWVPPRCCMPRASYASRYRFQLGGSAKVKTKVAAEMESAEGAANKRARTNLLVSVVLCAGELMLENTKFIL